MIEVFINQRKVKIDVSQFQEFAEKAVGAVDEARGKSATVAFVSDKRMRELNKIFRDQNQTTDVLSFPYEPDELDYLETENFLGDIVISLEQATRQAQENELEFSIEVKQLILHGILHLCGYDHETDDGIMNSLELQLRQTLKIDF